MPGIGCGSAKSPVPARRGSSAVRRVALDSSSRTDADQACEVRERHGIVYHLQFADTLVFLAALRVLRERLSDNFSAVAIDLLQALGNVSRLVSRVL